MAEINASIDFDQRLWREDIEGSKAHAAMLAQQKIITTEDAATIREGLDRVAAEIEAGTFEFRAELEDIHMNIEARLAELIGEPRPAAYRALAQRPGRDRFPALAEACHHTNRYRLDGPTISPPRPGGMPR